MDYSLEEKNKVLLIGFVLIVVISATVGLVLYRQKTVLNKDKTSEQSVLQANANQIREFQGLEKQLEFTPEFQAEFFPQQQQPQQQPQPQQPQQQLQVQLPAPSQKYPQPPKGPCAGLVCPDGFFCIEKDDKCVAQPISYCGDGICKESESRDTCFVDCVYLPMENEEVISYGNIIAIYNSQLGGEWQMLKLRDSLNCISIIKDKFMIDLPEPAKTKMLILSLLVGQDEKTYSYVNSFGIVHIQNIKGHQSLLENIDYFREQINEQEACLSFHELVHVFLFKNPIPLWASEGLATYADLNFNPARIKVECRENTWYGTDNRGGSLEQPYSDLSKPAGQNEEPGIYWYYTANCFWDYIQKNYGDVAIIAVLQEVKRNGDNISLDFIKDIVNKVLKQDITKVVKEKFSIP